ncbi:hypothetical protein ACLOAV_004530 [Pseudogymnoascus australis]
MNDRSRYPMTPDKSVPSYGSTLRSDTSSPSKSSSTSSTTMDPGAKMEWIGIMGEATGSAELGQKPNFRSAIMEIVGGKRESAMKPESARRFRTALDKMKSRNETSLSTRLMPFLVKNDRVVSEEQLGGKIRSFEDDFLDWNHDADFRTASVPIPADKAHVRDVDKAFGVKNPRPDVTFGFDSNAFSQDELRLFNRFDPELCKGIVSPFFAIQWKGSKGTANDAKVQVRRDGAAMVCARRKAQLTVAAFRRRFPPPRPVDTVIVPAPNISLERAYESINPSPSDLTMVATANFNPQDVERGNNPHHLVTVGDDVNLDTIAFSAAITPDLALIYVHWAQETGDKIIWHMALMKKFFMDDDEVPNIRAVMHNIIDWNLDLRMAALREELKVYKRIDEMDAEETANNAISPGKRRTPFGHNVHEWLIQDAQHHAVREVVGQQVLFEANKKEVEKETNMPFDSWMDITTVERYVEVWKQLLLFVFRAEDDEAEFRPPYQSAMQTVRDKIAAFQEWKEEKEKSAAGKDRGEDEGFDDGEDEDEVGVYKGVCEEVVEGFEDEMSEETKWMRQPRIKSKAIRLTLPSGDTVTVETTHYNDIFVSVTTGGTIEVKSIAIDRNDKESDLDDEEDDSDDDEEDDSDDDEEDDSDDDEEDDSDDEEEDDINHEETIATTIAMMNKTIAMTNKMIAISSSSIFVSSLQYCLFGLFIAAGGLFIAAGFELGTNSTEGIW